MSGFLKSLEKAVNNISTDVTRQVGYISNDVNRSVQSVWSCPTLDMFKTGNVLQLLSRSSGRSLQIVMSPMGQLVVDGVGPESPTAYHAHWTIINEGHNIIRLHNNNNYVAIVNGLTVVGHFPQPGSAGPETRFRVAMKGDFVTLESMVEIGRHIGILSDGQLKSAIATGSENDAQFGVRVVYSPTATVTTHTRTTVTTKSK